MDLAWKLIGGAAALLLAAAAVFSYLGKDTVKLEQQLAQRSEANLKATRERASDADTSLKENQDAFAEAEKLRDEYAKKAEETNAEEAEYAAQMAATKVELDLVKAKVKEIEKKVLEAGDIKKLIADVKDIENKIDETEETIANRDQKLRIAVEKVEAVKAEIDDYSELERRQRKALVADDFNAEVASVFPRWGFVLMNKGNRQGVYANAELEIERGGERVGRLYVTRVEQDRSVASVVADTWAEGTMPQPGDKVVPAPSPEAAATEDGQPAGEAALPGAGGAPGNELFGGGMAEPAAPAPGDDPFGGMAEQPAAPGDDPFGGMTEQPAAPSADPFGGTSTPTETPEPATPGAPPSNDPFGGL